MASPSFVSPQTLSFPPKVCANHSRDTNRSWPMVECGHLLSASESVLAHLLPTQPNGLGCPLGQHGIMER